MKASVEQLNPVQYRVSVEVAAPEVNRAFEQAFRKIQKQAKIQGFRPGKAPLTVIKRLYGGHVVPEVHEALINTHLFNALSEQTLRAVATPVVESKEAPAEGKDFHFSAVVDILPRLDFDDYKGLDVRAEVYAVKPETVERELAMLRRRHARTRETEPGQPAAVGNLAAISHTATVGGRDVPPMNVKGMTVVLGQNELHASLEQAIVGMTVGATKTVEVELPEDFDDRDLAGQTVTFTLTLDDLKHLDVPNLDDEFAKDLSFEDARALRQDVETHLAGRAKELGRQKAETAILDLLVERHPFEVPPAMVDQVIDSMIQEMPHRSGDERAKALKDPDLRQRCLATARRRTQNTLVLWHVTQREQLTVTDDEVRARVDQALASMGGLEPRQVARFRGNLEPRVRENLMFEKAMNFLIDHTKITEIDAAI